MQIVRRFRMGKSVTGHQGLLERAPPKFIRIEFVLVTVSTSYCLKRESDIGLGANTRITPSNFPLVVEVKGNFFE